MDKTLVLHPHDDVMIALESGAVPRGHKIARSEIAAGTPVRKFGHVIGVATMDIAAGAHVHVHNLSIGDHEDMVEDALADAKQAIPTMQPRMFDGFLRTDGRVGTRNTIALCATVNCSATVVQRAAQELRDAGALAPYPTVTDIAAFAHGTGCGMTAAGIGADILERTLWGHATHPNVGAAIFVGLGCEVMQVERMRARLGGGQNVHFLTIQERGGTRATIDAIKAHVIALLPEAARAQRTPCPASALTIGLQCGGSDGFSGVTANPVLGLTSDMIVGLGGTVLLSETPEIFGAEQLLLSRATSPDVANALRDMIDWWLDYAANHSASLDNNPTPGNKQGGLTTILEKSLGAVAKAGATPLTGVCDYAVAPPASGLVFMDSPGFDPVSVTGQIAAGAQIICFTTGRGSAFGSKPAPTIKIASNDRLMEQMPDDMDFGCGDILRGTRPADKAHDLLDLILATASGQNTKSETLGLGDNEFLPWQIGAVL